MDSGLILGIKDHTSLQCPVAAYMLMYCECVVKHTWLYGTWPAVIKHDHSRQAEAVSSPYLQLQTLNSLQSASHFVA